jgi:Skp family chaperone for outer membrane proteins
MWENAMRLKFTIALAGILAFSLTSRAQEDEIARDLEKVRSERTAALKKAKGDLLAEFDKKSEEIRESKIAVEKKVAMLDTLKKEREEFEAQDKLPNSAVLKAALTEYKRTLELWLEKLDAAFAKAIDAYTKAKDDARAKVLVKDRKIAIVGEGHELVGEWYLDPIGSDIVQRWTVNKVKGQWQVSVRYLSAKNQRQLGEGVGREVQYQDGGLTFRNVLLKSPDPKWPRSLLCSLKVESSDPVQLLLGQPEHPDQSSILRQKP